MSILLVIFVRLTVCTAIFSLCLVFHCRICNIDLVSIHPKCWLTNINVTLSITAVFRWLLSMFKNGGFLVTNILDPLLIFTFWVRFLLRKNFVCSKFFLVGQI